MDSPETLPLAGLRVLAIEQAVAAPFATLRLADAGAEVIKIERPEGDFARGYDAAANGQSSYFVWLNRGKTSRVLDLKTASAKAEIEKLLESTDVLVQNLKPGALERLGFGIERLQQDYPRLITCSISGYGETGPMSDRKAYDLLIQAEAGLCSLTGGPDEPARVGISVIDIATGATAYSAILEALIGRSISGRGSHIGISMFDVTAEWLTVPLLNHEAGTPPRRMGLRHPSIAPYGVFETKDGAQILLAVQSDREWRELCTGFIGNPGPGTDTRFATNVERVRNREATDAIVAAALKRLSLEKARAGLMAANVAFATVNDMEGLSNHPHLRRITVETENGPVSYPAPAPRFLDAPRAYGPVPGLKSLEE
ncbi:CaiB/BaiF CoA transferase family protein [Sinisalibacter aestuarii]|uniref:CoA transferase n=1 Tax=Sinisalibacter aestuarii TaxID=2949426 RepID=A0ABQ5LW60_9RHOB|nr:CaiB/BaiF CoA-transferase family protein [Sinisalibacter aestuarii]GKY89139.1 CoA transferase [Sinisalibacter aestuarii]